MSMLAELSSEEANKKEILPKYTIDCFEIVYWFCIEDVQDCHKTMPCGELLIELGSMDR